MPRAEYDKGKIEGHKLEIQEILSALNAASLPLDENPSVSNRAPHSAPINPHDTATISISESGTSLAPPSSIVFGMLITPRFFLLS